MDLIPPVSRTASGYREYKAEHLAYFICVRGMISGFHLSVISEVLKEARAQKIESAYWLVNKAQAELRQEKTISENIVKHLYHGEGLKRNRSQNRLTIQEVSKETGIPATTIRYWDKIGLLAAQRCAQNNYRLYTHQHVKQALALYALKLSAVTNRHTHFIERIKEEIKAFDYENKQKIKELTSGIEQSLAKINYLQIQGIAALHHLCVQVENQHFTDSI